MRKKSQICKLEKLINLKKYLSLQIEVLVRISPIVLRLTLETFSVANLDVMRQASLEFVAWSETTLRL